MPIQPKDTALHAALRQDFTAARMPRPGDDIGVTVIASLAASPEPLTACIAVFGGTAIPTGTYCLDPAGFLHRVHPQPPPLAHLAADVAVLLGGPATASAADFRRLALAAGIVSHHLATRLGAGFDQVTCDDEAIAWPLATVNASMTHLTTVAGKETR
ncbi:hypothetical protein [Catellatospora sichuanensis]|uniref:hypothetical protein n=1 Tax=Catellatospora sichuanensis TaxID=1969805 RepID=UPI001182C189|nr:hypothetical protein [Catellatospora sichuanensis]